MSHDQNFYANQHIGDFIVGKAINNGGQGSIYILYNRSNKKQSEYVLKIFDSKSSALRELKYYNILKVPLNTFIPKLYKYELFKLGSKYCLIIERFDETLNKHHKKDIVFIYNTLCDILTQIHGLGLVHHDLKPKNIMFKSGSIRPVLIDLGLMETYYPNNRTSFFGTKKYMSPNVLMTNKYYPSDDFISLSWTCLSLFVNLPWVIPMSSSQGTISSAENEKIKHSMAFLIYCWAREYKNVNEFASISWRLMMNKAMFTVIPENYKISSKHLPFDVNTRSNIFAEEYLKPEFEMYIKDINTITVEPIDWNQWSQSRINNLIEYSYNSLNDIFTCYKKDPEWVHTLTLLFDDISNETKMYLEYYSYEFNYVYQNCVLRINQCIKNYIKQYLSQIKNVQTSVFDTKNLISLMSGIDFKKYCRDNLTDYNDLFRDLVTKIKKENDIKYIKYNSIFDHIINDDNLLNPLKNLMKCIDDNIAKYPKIML